MSGPHGVPRADIVALLAEGHSDREIGRRLHTNPKRVGRIRSELGIPRTAPRPVLTLEQKWSAFTQPFDGDHLGWTGSLRGGTFPVLAYRGGHYPARQIAFRMAHGREPEGRVLAGCGWRPCVEPTHVEDARMRALYASILGAAS